MLISVVSTVSMNGWVSGLNVRVVNITVKILAGFHRLMKGYGADIKASENVHNDDEKYWMSMNGKAMGLVIEA